MLHVMNRFVTPPNEMTYYVDATNVCYWQNQSYPSLKVLLKLLIVLRRNKKQSFYCIFDAGIYRKLPPMEQEVYEQLLQYKDFFHEVKGGKSVDDYLIGLADAYNAPIVSNNPFSDPKYGRYKWLKEKDYRSRRLFMGEVISTPHGNHLMLLDLDINTTLNETLDSLFRLFVKILNPPEPKYKGKIKFFHERGWGRILFQTEQEIYFHKSFVIDPAAVLDPGQEVIFSIAENERGPHAKEIEVWLTGTVVHYDEYKELGNILIDNTNKELFFFKSYFEEPYFQSLDVGQRVTFVAGRNNKGDCARHIRLMNDTSSTIKILKERINHLEELLRSKESEINELQEIVIQQEDELETLKETGTPKAREQKQFIQEDDLVEEEENSHFYPEEITVENNEVEHFVQEEEIVEEGLVNDGWDDEEETVEVFEEEVMEEEEQNVIIFPEDATAEYFDTFEKRIAWWEQLDEQWKKALSVVSGEGESAALLADEKIQKLFGLEKLSFYRTSRHRLSFKLTNLQGIRYLTNLLSINVRGHEIEDFAVIAHLTHLEQLNCSENGVESFEGINDLESLEQLICMKNKLTVEAFKSLNEKLPKLVRLDARKNLLSDEDKSYVEGLAIEYIAV